MSMNAGAKFALGAVLIVGSVGYLMASGIKRTGQYFLTPSELAEVHARLDAAALLFKVRVLSNELRERETAPVAPRKTT